MRQNLPVTDHETHVAEDQAVVSKTDLDGNIVYVNPYFCQVSGYAAGELLGAPQNLLRHPDMPAEAFADLWASIRAGTPWTGLIKNRARDGGFYWIQANVTPIRENGKALGYMAVGVRPQPARVAAAQQAYRAIREKTAAKLVIKNGQLVKTGFFNLLGNLRHMSLALRIWLCTSVVNCPLLAVCLTSALSDGPALLRYGIFGGAFACFLVNIFLWHTLRASVLRPLGAALAGARAIAAGDLSGSFETDSTDEVGQLLRALQQMNSNLIATIRDVRANVQTMASATQDIAAGNSDLSGRTEAQASSLEQTATSIEQFASAVRQNADHSLQANTLAASAAEVALKGGAIVADVIATMDGISASSRQIGEIIGLIEGIAFQTNILALNAAVEAARAGEQGRGFAVVAGEVRALAQRSSAAARDIKQLIDVSAGKVGAGLSQVHLAGSTMEQVVRSVQQVTAIMGRIAQASREQSLGLDQVNLAIEHMDAVTQQNAALVEQAATAADSLAGEAGHLTQAVSLFQFGRPPTMPGLAHVRAGAPNFH